jgi:hypothetical protein
MSKTCQNCAQELPDTASVCTLCGAPANAGAFTLRDYIAEVYRCEQTIFTTTEMVNQLNKKIDELKSEIPPKPSSPDFYFNIVGSFFAWLIPSVFPASFLLALVSSLFHLNNRVSLSTFIILTFASWFGVTIAVACARKMFAHKRYKKAYTKYLGEMHNYPQVRKPFDEKITPIQAGIDTANSFIAATKHVLSDLYALDIIFAKYRNLVAVSSIYEYLNSGRCDALEGHEGAYNIFESEIRQDMIIVQLDRAIASLEEIRNTQYMLYDAIQESNRLAAQSAAEMRKIGASSALTAYYAKQSAKNSETLVNLNRDVYGTLRTKYGRRILG